MLALAGACSSPPASERPLRSPTRDYPPPPAQTSDGEVVGADRRRPEDTLETGPTNDGLAPGWSVENGKPKYDPSDRVGGDTDHESKADEDEHDDSATDSPGR